MAEMDPSQLFTQWPIAEIVGKTVSGIVVKKNPKGRNPFVQVFLVFDDQTSFEIYSSEEIDLDTGLYPRDLEGVRKYISPPLGPMEILLDVSLDEKKQMVVAANKRYHSIT